LRRVVSCHPARTGDLVAVCAARLSLAEGRPGWSWMF
jgi:hypothetical protein